jgi:hypothetical protein
MAETPVIKRGDSATPLYAELPTAPSGRALGASDTIFFRYRHVAAATGAQVTGVIHSLAERRVRYDWPNAAATQALTLGEYLVEVTVRYASDSKEETFPGDDASNTDAAEAAFPSKFIVRDRIATP